MITALQITNKAKVYGFDKCTIIPLGSLDGYEPNLDV